MAKGSLQTMQNWILTWRHVCPKSKTALLALYTQELKQGPKEQLRTWYEKIQEVGEDAYGRNKHMWALQQRHIVAQAFIAGCRYHKAHWHLKQDILEGRERLIDVHLDHCRNVFEESKGCENTPLCLPPARGRASDPHCHSLCHSPDQQLFQQDVRGPVEKLVQ